MLAAQSAFPSGPLAGFHEIFDQLIWSGQLMILKSLADR